MKLIHGDCLEKLRELPDGSVDAVVTDPPYGLSFMGKKWDYDVPSVDVWAECLRVLKPGGHLLAFAGTRTQHRMAVRIEDAGFEIRDMIAWVYGSGFPKSLDVSKAIDRAAGALAPEGKNFRVDGGSGTASYRPTTDRRDYVPPAPATEAARQWSGWGTALKPALEPITVARKPLIGTVADNVMQHGTGAINVDGCRVEAGERPLIISHGEGFGKGDSINALGNGLAGSRYGGTTTQGRWPANLIHDGSDEVMGLFPQTAKSPPVGSTCGSFRGVSQFANGIGGGFRDIERPNGYGDSGSAARFFYCAKASKADRDEGTDRNAHPTVKPTALMRYLVRLVTPPGGTVLDPFMGSGSTGKAAKIEGFDFIGIEREAEYIQIAEARIAAAKPELKQGELF